MKLIVVFFLVFFSESLFAQISSSYYVSVDDSCKLAVDVHLPENYVNEKLPVLVVFTRYWRASINRKTKLPNPPLDNLDSYFSKNGYVIVKVDTRGSGASFGTRTGEYTPIEVMDAKSIVDWIVNQTWCDGNIGSYGTSYEGTTAELLCAINHPAVKAVIPGWSDFDVYRSPVRPYGMQASGFINKWGLYVRLLDRNKSLILKESILPVEKDSLKLALKEHKKNPKIGKLTKKGEYRNSKTGAFTYEDCSPVHWKKEIEKSNVPMLVFTSWMDAGTSEGTLTRLEHYSNSQKVVMMATNHGGWMDADPFRNDTVIPYPKPTIKIQYQTQLDFFDQYLKGENKKVDDWPLIYYFNLGEGLFKKSDVWPIQEIQKTNFYFLDSNRLSENKPSEVSAEDKYKINFSVSTGKKNRWTTQMGGPVLNLNNRNEMDEKMLTYTTSPFEDDLQITGTPIINLLLSTTHKDGAVFVYLEDVDENGVSHYITEGGLRLIHRKILDDTTQFNLHSFNEEDAQLMEPGKIELIKFKLWPTSLLIKKGHCLRIAIAGADKDTFDKIPKKGKPTVTIYRNTSNHSFVELPVIKN
jgi:putative CocE/NonD family hydrolase